jgi:hypothetical protein
MLNHVQKHRSRFCRLITNLHEADENKLARRDCWGIAISGVLVALLVEFARLLLASR